MACVVLVFNDEQGNEQIRMGLCDETSAPVRLQDGSTKQPGAVVVGDYVQVYPGCVRRVDVIEVN